MLRPDKRLRMIASFIFLLALLFLTPLATSAQSSQPVETPSADAAPSHPRSEDPEPQSVRGEGLGFRRPSMMSPKARSRLALGEVLTLEAFVDPLPPVQSIRASAAVKMIVTRITG